jgi:hypothetical protein
MKLNSPGLFTSLLYVLLVAIPVFAQQNFGSINGTVTAQGFTEKIGNGWGIGGVIIAQSGQPYNIYDFTGGVASVYYVRHEQLHRQSHCALAAGPDAGQRAESSPLYG